MFITPARAVIALALAAFAPAASGQRLVFDTASVKINRSGFPGGLMDFRAGGQFTATNETLEQFVRAAYGLDVYRIFGGPEWMKTSRFDVQARAGADVTPEQTRVMLQALLADRFKLRTRTDAREMPTFRLVMSRPRGPLGPGLRQASPAACVERGLQPGRVPAGELPSCGLLPAGPERMSGRRVGVDLLTAQLSSMTGRVVIDETTLMGTFDIDLEWAMTDAQAAALAVLTPPGGTPPTPNPSRPGLFAALDEQLGLKLEASTGRVSVLVVDQAELPSEN